MLSRKHYIRIAEIIKSEKEKGLMMNELIEDLAKYFEEENPNFDKNKFIQACYLKN